MATPFDSHTFATLIDRGVLQIGDGHRAKLSELGGDGPIFLRAGLLSDDGIRLQGADRFREDVAVASAKFTRGRDTFVTTKGNSVGRTGYIPPDSPQLVYSPHLSYWRSLDRETLDPEFLRYWAKSPDFVSQLHAMAHGTDMAPYLSLIDQKRLAIRLPSIQEQRCIARVLGTLDDKIDSNRRLAAVLEETAATIFRARLMDFVGVEEFEESEIGRIPRGWRVSTLGEVTAVLTRGRAPAYVEDFGVLVVNQRCIRDKQVLFANARRNDETKRSSHDRRLRVGDLLVNSTGVGTLGRVAQVRWLPADVTVDGHVTMIRADGDHIVQDYMAAHLMQREAEIEGLAQGSTGQTELSRTRLSQLPILVPPLQQQRAFARLHAPVREKIASLEQESETLALVRDSLLPKLISGELRVPDTTDQSEVVETAREALAAAP